MYSYCLLFSRRWIEVQNGGARASAFIISQHYKLSHHNQEILQVWDLAYQIKNAMCTGHLLLRTTDKIFLMERKKPAMDFQSFQSCFLSSHFPAAWCSWKIINSRQFVIGGCDCCDCLNLSPEVWIIDFCVDCLFMLSIVLYYSLRIYCKVKKWTAPTCLVTKLGEECIGIAKVMTSNPVRVCFYFSFFFPQGLFNCLHRNYLHRLLLTAEIPHFFQIFSHRSKYLVYHLFLTVYAV